MDEFMLNLVGGIFLFMFGACIGSFLNVVVYRLPLGISIILPASSCTHCKKRVPIIGLIPVFGYFLLRGKCYYCKDQISIRYPLVEMFAGILTVIVTFHSITPAEIFVQFGGNIYGISPLFTRLRYGFYLEIFRNLWLLYAGLTLSLIDFDYGILPDVITLPGTLISLLFGWLTPEVGIINALLGILVGAGGLFLVAKIYEIIRKREGLGMGDVKYLAFIGAALGWQGVIWVIALSSILGAFIGIIYALKSGKGLSYALPFGPFLAIAAFLMAMWGNVFLQFFYG